MILNSLNFLIFLHCFPFNLKKDSEFSEYSEVSEFSEVSELSELSEFSELLSFEFKIKILKF